MEHKCYACGKITERKVYEVSNIGEVILCDSCESARFTSCISCDRLIRNSELWNNRSGENYCQSCYEDLYFECQECGVETLSSLGQNGSNGDSLCPSCYLQEQRNENIEESHYEPDYHFYKLAYENTCFMGFELEVELSEDRDRGSASKKLIQFLEENNLYKYFYFKQDGSLENGFEIVSHPFTLAYSHKKFKLMKLLKYLKTAGFTSYDTGNCGFHIHLDRRYLSEENISTMRAFFIVCKEYLKKLSGRKGTGNGYCSFEGDLTKEQVREGGQDGRYWAFNMNTEKNTVEIRVFRGTLKHRKIVSFLQFAEAFHRFSREYSFDYVWNSEPGKLWKEFVEYIKRRGYTHLYKEIKGDICA